MDKVELEFEFAINSPEAKAEAEQVKKSITGVGDTAEQQAKRVEQAVKRISVLDDSTIAHLKKQKDAKAAMYDEAAASISKKAPTPSNNLPSAVNEVNKLTIAQKASNAAHEVGSGLIGDLIGNLTIWGAATAAVTGIVSLYKEEIYSWAKGLITGKDANDKLTKSIEAQSEALGSGEYKNAIENVVELKQEVVDAKKGFLDKTKVVEHYNETMGKTAGVVKTVDEVQQKLIDKGDAYIQMVLDQATANIVLEKSAQKAAEAEQRKLDGPSVKDYVTSGAKALATGFATGRFDAGAFVSGAETEKIIAVAKLNKEAKQGVELFKELKEKSDAFAKSKGLNAFSDSKVITPKTDVSVNERKNLLSQLERIDKEYSRKSFSKDEEELTALKDKFAKMRSIVLDFNKRNPKAKISLVELNKTEERASSDLSYRQQTAKQKILIDEQKKLYAEYESYKTTFGEAKAKERFNTEIKTNKQLIKELTADNEKLVLKAKTSSLSAPEQERLNQNKKDVAELQNLEDKRYAAAYESALTTAQKIERINEEYRGKAKELGAAITGEQKDNLLKLRDEAVNAAKDEALQKTEIYKKLSEETIELTSKQVKEQIAILKTLMANGSITGDAKTELQNQLGKLEFLLKVGVNQSNLDALKNRLANLTTELNATDGIGNSIVSPKESKRILKDLSEIQSKINSITNSGGTAKSNFAKGLAQNFSYLKGSSEDVAKGISKDLGQVSGALGNLSNSFGGLDTKAGYALGTVSELASVGSDAAGAFASFASGDIVGGITGAIKAVAGLFSIGKRVKEMNAAARQEVADFYANAISGERVYQDLLAQRALQNVRDNKALLKGIRDEVALRKTQLNSYAKETAEIMAKLQGQSSIASETYKHGTWFRKAEVKKTYSSLAGKSFQELSQLLAQGKLEGDAKALVERLKEIEEKGYDAEQAMADLARETSELFTGTSADNLTNSLLDMFRSGKTGVQDLADFFKATMDDAALSIFKNKVLSDLMMKFYDEFDKAAQSDESLTDSEIANLQNLFTTLTDDAKKKFEELKKITGSDFTQNESSGSAAKVQRSITEDTANDLIGTNRAIYEMTKQNTIATKENTSVNKAMHALQIDSLALLREQLLVGYETQANTANTVVELKNAVIELKAINTNTKTQGSRATS